MIKILNDRFAESFVDSGARKSIDEYRNGSLCAHEKLFSPSSASGIHIVYDENSQIRVQFNDF